MGASRAGAISSVAQCGLGWTGSKKRMGIFTTHAARAGADSDGLPASGAGRTEARDDAIRAVCG
jgi:hypothetical protein